MDKIETAEQLAKLLASTNYLTHRSQVNLEGTIQNMMLDGIKIEKIKYYLDDLLGNIDFLD
jgi:hypothetical protein